MMAKRLFDLVASTLGLVCLAPLLVLVSVAVVIDSPGPALYSGRRVGRQGREFRMLKFRSMVVGADRRGAGITISGDNRVTRLGRILRRTKLDELPQLVNVLKGDMSLVGPRPEDPRYVALYNEEQRATLQVRPGVTGLASIAYRDEESQLAGLEWERHYIDQIMPDKLALEALYLKQRSFWSDIRIMLATLVPGLAALPFSSVMTEDQVDQVCSELRRAGGA